MCYLLATNDLLLNTLSIFDLTSTTQPFFFHTKRKSWSIGVSAVADQSHFVLLVGSIYFTVECRGFTAAKKPPLEFEIFAAVMRVEWLGTHC